MKKRITGLLLAVIMIVGMLPIGAITAFAAAGTLTEFYCLDVGEGAYINTNYMPTSNTRVVFDAEVSDCLTGAVLFGVDFHANDANYSFYVNGGHNYDVGVDKNVYGSGWGPGDDWGWHTAPFLPGRQTVELSPGQFKLGDTVYKTYDPANFASPLPLYLFAVNFFANEVHTFQNQQVRFYSCQIYEGDKLVCDFVPAANSNEVGVNTFGVYDKQSKKFYDILGDGTVKPLTRTTVSGKPSTCIETGYKQYYKCGDRYYKDEDCREPIENLDTWKTTPEENGGGMISATGHNWTDAEKNKAEKPTLKTAATCVADAVYYKVCSVCDAISDSETWTKSGSAAGDHQWSSYDYDQHKCTVCNAMENHTDGNGDGKCDKCNSPFCQHKNIKITYDWNDTYTDCTATKHCDDCNRDILVEHAAATVISNVPGANCIEQGIKTVSATFTTLGSEETTIPGEYGSHNFQNGECTICGRTDTYISRSWNEQTKEVDETVEGICENATRITNNTTTLLGGWYVVSSDVEIGSRITVTGTPENPTNIILADGCTLNAKLGINVAKGNALNIYGQSGDSGKIIATGDTFSAGIGGTGNDNDDSSDGGNVTVYGGTVTAIGGEYCAGIGGSGDYGDGGNVTVYGGTVTATGGNYGAGIGSSGYYALGSGDVTIYGGTVTATGGPRSEGIGISEKKQGSSSHGTLSIPNEYLMVKAGNSADDAIDYTAEKYIADRNRYVQIVPSNFIYHAAKAATCTEAGYDAYYEYKGKYYQDSELLNEIPDIDVWRAPGGEGYRAPEHNWENINATQHKCKTCGVTEAHNFQNGECTVCGRKENYGKYIVRSWDEQNNEVISAEENVPQNVTEITTDTATLSGGWYIVASNISIGSRITVTGTPENPTKIILMDGCTLNARNGIRVSENNVLHIYGQKKDSGKIIADGNNFGAGIGGNAGKDSDNGENGGTVTVYGGTVNADGGMTSAGIGGGGSKKGQGGDGGTVTVYGGTVIAAGYTTGSGAGIGGGDSSDGGDGHNGGDGGTVTINGGTVIATGGNHGATGIGGGKNGSHGMLFIVDGYEYIIAGTNADNAVSITVAQYLADRKTYVEIHVTCVHNFVNYVCEFCGYVNIAQAKVDAIAVIDTAAGDDTRDAVAQYVSSLKNDIKNATTVAEISSICENGVAKIEELVALCDAKENAIVEIDVAAGDDTRDAVVQYVSSLKNDIENATTVEEISSICENGVAKIEELVALCDAKENAIAKIDAAAGENPSKAVTLLVKGAKAEIDSKDTDTFDKIINIQNEWIAEIEKLTGTTHEHTYSENWSCDPYYHWHDSICEHGGLTSDFGEHTFGEGVADGNITAYTCTECGYKKYVYNTAGDDEGEIISGTTYTGISLTLGSDISINFYMDLTEEARNNGTMTFDIGGRIVTVDGKDAKYNETEKKYYFQTPLTALEMAEIITATFNYNGIDYVQKYSVADYIDEIVHNEEKYGNKAVALAKKIANYGYYAQIYLESIHTNVHIVDPYTEPEKGYDRIEPFGGEFDINTQKAIEALASYSVTVSGTSDNLSLYGSTVYFDSATALNYYVTVKNGVKPTATAVNTVTGKEKAVEIKLYKDNIYIVSVKDITATELADEIEVTINGELTIKGSVFAYCNAVMTKDGQTDVAKNAMAAFYEYYEAAVDYAEAAKPVYYDVTFNMGTHGEDITVKVKKGEKVEIPENPVYSGYVFDGWYTDNTYNTRWDFDTAITENTTIYSKWIEKTEFTVTFDMMGHGEQVSSQKVKKGEYAQRIVPEADGYRFGGWYMDKDFQIPWVFSDDSVNSDITLYAYWQKRINVTYDCMGYSENRTMVVSEGNFLPSDPFPVNVPGYTIEGWYKDSNFTEKWNLETDIVGDTDFTLYAKWIKVSAVNFELKGHGIKINQQIVAVGGKVQKPEDPTAEGWKFEGWYKDADYHTPWNFETDTVGDHDIILFAKWTENAPVISDGYYLVGTLNGGDFWDVSALTPDMKLDANADVPGEYNLEWTFYLNDEFKIAKVEDGAITAWYNDGEENYKIEESIVGDRTVYFRPASNPEWSFYFLTVQ